MGVMNKKTSNTESHVIMATPNIIQLPTIDYDAIKNKPQIDGVTLTGNLSAQDLMLYGVSNPETYVFEQKTPLAVWAITHDLNKYPSCTVVDSAGSVVVGEVTYIDKSNLVITFSAGFSGTCYLN